MHSTPGGTPETNPPDLFWGCGQDGLANGFPGRTTETNPSSTQPFKFGEHPQNFAPSGTQSSGALRRPRDRQRDNLPRDTIEPDSRRVHRFRLAGRSGSGRQARLPETVDAPCQENSRHARLGRARLPWRRGRIIKTRGADPPAMPGNGVECDGRARTRFRCDRTSRHVGLWRRSRLA